MELPPIPPNCPLLVANGNSVLLSVHYADSTYPIMGPIPAEWRQIVAALAYTAWMEESWRRYKDSGLETYPDGSRFLEEQFSAKGEKLDRLRKLRDQKCDDVDECETNAHAWLRWREEGK